MTSPQTASNPQLGPRGDLGVLVTPLAHIARLEGLELEAASHMMAIALRVEAALRTLGVASGVNLLLADGECAGQEVPHVHLHVVPRQASDGLRLRLGGNRPRRASRSELDEFAARLASDVQRTE